MEAGLSFAPPDGKLLRWDGEKDEGSGFRNVGLLNFKDPYLGSPYTTRNAKPKILKGWQIVLGLLDRRSSYCSKGRVAGYPYIRLVYGLRFEGWDLGGRKPYTHSMRMSGQLLDHYSVPPPRQGHLPSRRSTGSTLRRSFVMNSSHLNHIL